MHMTCTWDAMEKETRRHSVHGTWACRMDVRSHRTAQHSCACHSCASFHVRVLLCDCMMRLLCDMHTSAYTCAHTSAMMRQRVHEE